MKKILLSLLLIISSSTYASDCNQSFCVPDCSEFCVKSNGFYVGGFGGVNLQDCSRSEVGYDFAMAIGYRWLGRFRSELEYSYRNNNYKSQRLNIFDYEIRYSRLSVSTYAVMFNTLWDLPFCNFGAFQPFVGGGIGYGEVHGHGKASLTGGDNFHLSSKDRIEHKNFAWQIIAGLAYPICSNIDVSAEYRLFKVKKAYYNHSVGMGLKYHF